MPVDEEPVTPEQPETAPSPAALPDIENLADSDDAGVIEARAKLLEAQATLTKASAPLLDRVIIRGLLPLALAVVGPWALWKFDASQIEQKKQGEVIVALQQLLEGAKEEAASRKTRSLAWRARMGKIDEEKAAELAAMSAMVIRLDSTLKTALIQMTVSRLLSPPAPLRGMGGAQAPSLPKKAEVIRAATLQLQIDGIDDVEIKRLAGQQYDRIIKQRQLQAQDQAEGE